MTNREMAHEEAREALEALALDALDASERGAVLAHLAGCAACREELVALKATAAELTYAVKPVPMSPAQRERVRARLLARAGADHPSTRMTPPHVAAIHPANAVTPQRGVPARTSQPTPVVPIAAHHDAHAPHGAAPGAPRTGAGIPTPAASPFVMPKDVMAFEPPRRDRRKKSSSSAQVMAIAAGILAVGSTAALYQARHERDQFRDALQMATVERRMSNDQMDSLRSAVTQRDRTIANLTGSQVTVMTLAAGGLRAPSARMFWDQSANMWTFVGHNLPRPKPGRAYQVWLVTANNAKVSAGMFTPDAAGDVMMHASYPLAKDQLSAVAVTDEPEQGSEQPTTVPFIVGRAGR